MKKRRSVSFIAVSFFAVLLLVLSFLVRLMLHRPPAVELPVIENTAGNGSTVGDVSQESIRRVEVTPQTVQLVIARLTRPARYTRTMTLERFWTDGSGSASATVCAADGWMRVDVTGEGVEARHTILGGGRSWVWYGTENRVFTGTAAFSADKEQGVPTYEMVLDLPVDAIAAADYRTREGVQCIYVETASDEFGYTERYWVSVDNGLLVAAERFQGETLVFRMSGFEVNIDEADLQQFRLPDGEMLYQMDGTEGDTQ